ncbi:MAG: hypothetical protein KC435_05210 [Thermomicrobiales bacterium]|nr:hypothetical protein [Thermomicrobiales bacterium]
MIAHKWPRTDVVRWFALLTLSAGILMLVQTPGLPVRVGIEQSLPGQTVVQLFLSSLTLTAFGAFGTALDRTRAWHLLQAPLRPAQLWRRVIVAVLADVSAPLLVMATFGMWKIGSAGIMWHVVAALWMIAGNVLGTVLTIQLWAIRTQRVAKFALPAIPAIVAIVMVAAHVGAFTSVSPVFLTIDPLLIVVVGIGVGAHTLGDWYVRTAQDLIHSPLRGQSWLGPLPDILDKALHNHANPTLAITLRDITLQSRDGFFAIRYVLVLASAPLWLILRSNLGDNTASLIVLLLVGCYGYLEITPSPIGMEGDRFTHTWFTPVSAREILLGKLLGVIVVNIAQITVGAGVLILAGSDVRQAFPIALTITLVTGIVITAMSTFDLDMRLSLNSPVQVLTVEHLPFRVWRLLAIGLASGLGGMLVFGMRQLHHWQTITTVLLGCVMAAVAFYIGERRLTSILARPAP